MKHLFALCLCASVLKLSATPFAPDPATEVVVYSPASSSQLHVSTMPADNLELPFKWTFNAPATGWSSRTVLRVPTDTNAVLTAYLDTDGSGSYTPGEPFGVSNMRDTPEIELTDMSAITPRVDLWSGEDVGSASDRAVRAGLGEVLDGKTVFDPVTPAEKTLVSVTRFNVDGHMFQNMGLSVARKVLFKAFKISARRFLHEGDFLADGKLDIDWDKLYDEIVRNFNVYSYGCSITNVSYLITYNWDPNEYLDYHGTNKIRACSTLVTRRFELERTVPTPVSASVHSTSTATNLTFRFRIDGEDTWASWFGTTYTAFKVKVMSGSTEVWNSGIRRLPHRDQNGVYTFQTSQTFQASQTLTWRVALYNAKFKTDTLMSVDFFGLNTGDPFSPAQPITAIGD